VRGAYFPSERICQEGRLTELGGEGWRKLVVENGIAVRVATSRETDGVFTRLSLTEGREAKIGRGCEYKRERQLHGTAFFHGRLAHPRVVGAYVSATGWYALRWPEDCAMESWWAKRRLLGGHMRQWGRIGRTERPGPVSALEAT